MTKEQKSGFFSMFAKPSPISSRALILISPTHPMWESNKTYNTASVGITELASLPKASALLAGIGTIVLLL
jgi:hypothetical protein